MSDKPVLKEIIIESFKLGYRLIGNYYQGAIDLSPYFYSAHFVSVFLFIDTARVYRNEEYIGEIMADLGSYGLKRDELFLTTKLSMSIVWLLIADYYC